MLKRIVRPHFYIWVPRIILIALSLTATACIDNSVESFTGYRSLSAKDAPYHASVTVNIGETFPTNSRLLGNNIQWVDRGDELLVNNGTTDFSPLMLDKVIGLKPTVLRYPGGSLSDLYRWRNGMGEVKDRKASSRFHGSGEDTILFGSREFLRLCQLTGAEPLLTANIITAPPEETLDWIRQINFRGINYQGKPLPKVEFLEIGNEPYLIDDNQKELAITAKEYVERANSLVSKLRLLDPSVNIGIPLRSDDFDGIPVTPMPGFNKEVLEGFSERIDFVALHNTYFPFIWQDIPAEEEQIYLASMAASNAVRKDIDRTRKQLKKYRKEKHIPIAITEMNSMFSIGKGKTDEYIQSLTGAIYIADMLTLLSHEPDIIMANFWSLTGNWNFGVIDQSGRERVTYRVLAKFHSMLTGMHVRTTVVSPSFDIIQTGFLAEQKGISFISALATLSDNNKQLKIWVINKHPLQNVSLSLFTNETKNRRYSVESLTTKDYFSVSQSKDARWEKVSDGVFEEGQSLELAPHSINLISIVNDQKI